MFHFLLTRHFASKIPRSIAEVDFTPEKAKRVREIFAEYGIAPTRDRSVPRRELPESVVFANELLHSFYDTSIPPDVIPKRPYPWLTPVDTLGRPAVFRMLKLKPRERFDKKDLMEKRMQHLVPVMVSGTTPDHAKLNSATQQDFQHFWLEKKFLVRELKETGVWCRMYKTDIDVTNAATEKLESFNLENRAIWYLRSVDVNPLNSDIESAIFSRYLPGEPCKIRFPLRFINASQCAGVKLGGILLYQKHCLDLHFKGDILPPYPECAITVDLKNLELHKQIRLKNLKLPRGCINKNLPPNTVLVTCKKITGDLISAAATEEKKVEEPAKKKERK